MRCDLHVHSTRSGRVDLPLLSHLGNECYSTPQAIYDRCHNVGMDLVTITDHDTVEGALEIAGLPGVFISEEVTLHLPGERRLHVGVLDIDSQQHARLTALRQDAEAFFAYCAEQRLPVCVNHPFSASAGPRQLSDLDLAFRHATLVETQNGMLPDRPNSYAAWAAEAAGLRGVGGSDAHTLTSIGHAHTEVPGARSQSEFVEGLRCGWTLPRGRGGSYARFTADIVRVLALACEANLGEARRSLPAAGRAAALLSLLLALPLLPLISALQYGRDCIFAAAHFGRFRAACGTGLQPRRPRVGGIVGAGAPAGAMG